MNVHLTDVTQGLAAVNLAGPRAREILASCHRSRLLDRGVQVHRRQARADRRRALPDHADRVRRRGRLRDPLRGRPRRARVGRADAAPAKPNGLRPFGLEPQRILRLQKLHIIVGQDTDSESTPVRRGDAVDRQARQGAGLHRQVGARALRRGAARDAGSSGSRWPHGYGPDRGRRCRRRAGRPRRPGDELARYSPTLERVIGMAWVPSALAQRWRHDHDLRRGPHARAPMSHQAVLRPGGGGAPLVSFEFLMPDAAVRRSLRAVARSPMEGKARRPARASRSGRLERRRRVSAAGHGRPVRGLHGRLASAQARASGRRRPRRARRGQARRRRVDM